MRQIKNGYATETTLTVHLHAFRGAVYDENNKLVLESQRTRSGNNEWNPDDPEEIIRAADPLYFSGRSLYLGHYTGHYGHFLLETMSRFWIFLEDAEVSKKYDHFIFHPFLHKMPSPERYSPAKIAFEYFGIDLAKIVFLNRPTAFEHISVPKPYFNINFSVDERMQLVYKKIQEYSVGLPSSNLGFVKRLLGWPKQGTLKIYLSRRKAKGYHPMRNETEVEKIFEDAGFKILHPERWNFEQQLAVYQRAEIIAGVEGSALHNSLFMRAGSKVISLGTPRVPSGVILNQNLCNSLSAIENRYIEFKGEVDAKNRAHYDVEHIRRELFRCLS